MASTGPTVMLVAHSQYRGVFMGIAKRLKAELGARIHLYTVTAQQSSYYARTYPELFVSTTVANTLYEGCRKSVDDDDTIFDEARQNEIDLGVTINELAVSDRHLGRGFALGGFRHPRSQVSEETTYVQMLNGFNAVIDFWRGELDEKQPDLVINAGKVLCVLARARDVPVRILAGSRYQNYYYWAVNEFFENPEFERAYRAANPGPDLGLEKPYDAHLRFRAHFRKEASAWRVTRATGYLILRQLYWTFRGYEKAKVYYLRENVAYLWRRYRDIRRMTRRRLLGIEGATGSPFAFFPLATEPEAALQTLSPEFLYQLSAIASVARDLPAGAVLVVKEHYAAAGRRPADFYDQIREFKNVQMMNMAEFGMEAVRASRAVVTISGTSGFEGAILGKPVITFGRHNIYNFLPHVMVVTDETQLKGYLSDALSESFDSERAAVDGRRFLQAVIDASFDLEDFQPIEPDIVSDAAIDRCFCALRDGLDTDARASVAV